MPGTLTWLGHAAFRLDSPGGKRIYVDPWLSGPTVPESEREPERVDLIALTHGHADHVGETLALYKKFSCPVVALVELRGWLSGQGLDDNMSLAPNKGGTVNVDGIRITLTDAHHSSSANDGTYLGEPAGLVIELEDGTTVYFAGDTNAFMDMQLIGRIYAPDIAVLPIGDHFTMGPREAAVALELLGVKRCVPSHYGTFPLLHGTPAGAPQARAGGRGRGDRARRQRRAVRQRWFGDRGLRVPELAVEGDPAVPLEDALVLDSVDDEAALREAHAAGVPVVVRASSADAVRRALARPEVAAVLVPAGAEELLELDLTGLTYG